MRRCIGTSVRRCVRAFEAEGLIESSRGWRRLCDDTPGKLPPFRPLFLVPQPEGLLDVLYTPRMASTLTKLLMHVTFSTKDRLPLIAPDAEPDLFAYIGGICRRMESPLLTVNGVPDHVHLLVSLAKTVSLSELLLNIKRDSSKLMKERAPGFGWQDGYFGFSIGESGVRPCTRTSRTRRLTIQPWTSRMRCGRFCVI